MKGRHALLVGFGLGGLVVLALVLAFNFNGLLVTPRTAAHVSPSPTPSMIELPHSPAPTAGITPLPAPTTPAPGGAMAYDPEDHGLIYFGGATTTQRADGTNLAQSDGDTWLWDGRAWAQLQVSGPPARSAEMIAYDSLRHQIVLFGGSGPAGVGQALLFDDTWTWDGSQWQQQHPAHVPNPRMRAAIAFDERRGVVVMFGGEGEGTTTYNATWTWDGGDWTLMDPASAPPGRHFATMAYDEARGLTVLFGGSMAGARFSDTWTWDGSNWTQQGSPPPAARGWSSLAYDAATSEVVAYVYFALDNNPVQEYTITWDGTKWTDRTGAGDPSPRAETRVAYDPDTRQVVLYGGALTGPAYTETWTWDGQRWSLWHPAEGA